MVTLRGRAATPVRPGLVTKAVLLGQTPLATGELVSEASITDLHNAYKELVKRENMLRPRIKRLKPMTMQSFKTLFKFAQLLGLVELVREDPMEFPPPTGHLYSIRKPNDEVIAVISTRRIFKITPLGTEDERSWTNLCRAWIDKWPAPAKAEYLPPVYVPRERPPKPPKEEPPELVLEFTPYELAAEPSTAQFSALAAHLRTLNALGLESPGVVEEVARLTHGASGWVVVTDEGLDDARAIRHYTAMHELEIWLSRITIVREALLDQDLPRAIESLDELTG